MPAPPTEIRIKRKATDDPVELLHVQNDYNGLRQFKQYVFKRQRTSSPPKCNILNSSNKSSFRANQHSISFTGAENIGRAPQLTEAPVVDGRVPGHLLGSSEEMVSNARTGTFIDQSSDNSNGRPPPITGRAEPRRFHLSRNLTSSHAGMVSGNSQRARGSSAVFIERTQTTDLDRKTSDTVAPPILVPNSHHDPDNEDPKENRIVLLPPESHQLRPSAPLRNTRLPSGKVMPWNADSATLAAEMQAYTLQEIGHNIAMTSPLEVPIASTPIIRARQVSSFKPRATALRHHEHGPGQIRPSKDNKKPERDEIMADASDPDGNEADYVMDIYIRLPAEMFELQEQKSIGLLVLDSQPDIDDFYNDESDSDSEPYDEEEDENAENHPSTDYPDDEIESDDEYGRNPYQRYRNRNASDNEEFDENDAAHSDDEAKPPWARRPWMFNDSHGKDGQHDEDDD